MRTIALYNRQGKHLITLKEAQQKGYGTAYTLKQRIRRGHLKGYKVAHLWVVLQDALPRPAKRRATTKKRAKAS